MEIKKRKDKLSDINNNQKYYNLYFFRQNNIIKIIKNIFERDKNSQAVEQL